MPRRKVIPYLESVKVVGSMAPRSTPTARHRRLGAELRKLREHAGMSVLEAAGVLGGERPLISNIESGRVGVSEERLRRLTTAYGCSDEALVGALAQMTGLRRRHWWEEYRGKLPAGLLDMAELEHHAARMRAAQTVHIPGLLQTEDHARAVFSLAVPPLSRLEVELRVAHRMERKRVLAQPGAEFSAVLHEAALHMGFGGAEVARAQCQHLLDMGEREGIDIQVIPFGTEGFPGAGQSILYACGPVPELDTVQLDTAHGVVFIDSPAELANYRSLLDLMEQRSLDPEASRAVIHKAKEQWK
ncbi:helix-turn-helix domain-containing protein [Wenjunlia vitaminophila]|nr:helix-turn-helix transcriptional regulator [Wenjunlia vitaminophila]